MITFAELNCFQEKYVSSIENGKENPSLDYGYDVTYADKEPQYEEIGRYDKDPTHVSRIKKIQSMESLYQNYVQSNYRQKFVAIVFFPPTIVLCEFLLYFMEIAYLIKTIFPMINSVLFFFLNQFTFL